MKKITLLGASGSVGSQTLDIIEKFEERFELIAISVHTNIHFLLSMLPRFLSLKYICVTDLTAYDLLKNQLDQRYELLFGDSGLEKIATLSEVNYVINALVGFAGLKPTMSAINAHKDIGLANKETLVAAGQLVMTAAQENGISIYPIDSEHSAIFQCLQGENIDSVEKIILTASGGPFYSCSREDLKSVTPKMALKHPNWNMGPKISIDSATMVNKGLEVIEAHYLFNIPYDKIDVIIHPQSIIHSMVQFKDGAIKAQLGSPDMHLPIMYALSAPDRLEFPLIERINFNNLNKMEFYPPNITRFPALKLAYDVLKIKGTMGTVYNAANEVAVASFLDGKLPFDMIEKVISLAMDAHQVINDVNLDTIISVDQNTRKYVTSLIKKGLV